MSTIKISKLISRAKSPAFDFFVDNVIRPCLKYCGNLQISLEDFILQWFHAKYRTIDSVKVKRPFKIPGRLLRGTSMFGNNRQYTHAEKDDLLWIRFDARNPMYVEVQLDKAELDVVYRLTKPQFRSIISKIEEL